MSPDVSSFVMVLVLTNVITEAEADVLAAALPGKSVNRKWRDLVAQVEEIIGRSL